MFPLSDSIKTKSFPFVTILLITSNVYVFYLEFMAKNMDAFINQYALIPRHIVFSDPQTFVPFFTALFLHAGIFHIISNMWFLWIFGDDVEDYIGKINFILLYFASGIAGNALQFVMTPQSPIPMLGASGAISGILGAYYVFFPQSKIKTLIFIIFFVSIVDIPAGFYLLYWFIIQLFSGAGSSATSQAGGVAFMAHIGGFITGVLYARYLAKNKNKNYIEGEIVES